MMPKNEEGEVEVILGNKQLLFVFFVVAVLLGVFFTMGYVLGRNVAAPTAADIAQKTEPKPVVVERATPNGPAVTKEPGSVTETKPVTEAKQPEANAVESKAVETKAEAKEESKPAKKEKETSKEKEAKKESAAKKEHAKSEEEPEAKPSTGAGTPAAGMYYLQLGAMGETEAQIVVGALRKKHFRGMYVPVPGKSLYRALAGPFKDTTEVSQARQDLNKAGFDGFGAILRKF